MQLQEIIWEYIGLHNLALLPAFLVLYVISRQSLTSAFQRVYIPVLMLLPNYYRCFLPGLPDLTFNQAAILPLFAVFLWRGPRWRWSFTDALVVLFAFAVGYSEYSNTTYKDAQNLLVDMVASVVLPYALAKGLIEPSGERESTARILAISIFFTALIGVYEFKMGVTPFRKILDPFFAGQANWVTTFRWGLVRVAGPYGHAILAGVIMVIGYRLARWLQWNKSWPRYRWLPSLAGRQGQLICLGLAAGVVMSMCRGPWLGALLAAAVANVALVKKRRLVVRLGVAAGAAVGIPMVLRAWSWASVGREHATSISQETAAYRKELLDNYIEIGMDQLWWGWGKLTWPKLASMPSIDNYYLLLFLMHGIMALGVLVALFAYMAIRLYRRAMAETNQRDASFAFTMLAIYLSIMLNLVFVYLGETLVPLAFVLTGWAESFLLRQGPQQEASGNTPVVEEAYAFRRILA